MSLAAEERVKAFQEWTDRHSVGAAPVGAPRAPATGGQISLHDDVLNALPVKGTKVKAALRYGMSLWGQAVKLETILPTGESRDYLLKLVSIPTAKYMIEGEHESLKHMHAVVPSFVPQPFACGHYAQDSGNDCYFLLEEFRHVGEQPPDPLRFTAKLAELHKKSVSPTGKFGFSTMTCHGKVAQMTNQWDDSWSVVYQRHLGYMVEQDLEQNGLWPEFKVLCDITLEKVIPRLLEPLQSEGRSIKPCLVHGDLWDENTATDMRTGEPFIFDPGSMYAHNEYETGNWRAIRHRLSNRAYVRGYKRHFPASEPENEWDARNILYSLRYNLGAAILFPGSVQRKDVFDDMKTLCEEFFPDLLRNRMVELRRQQAAGERKLSGAQSDYLDNGDKARFSGDEHTSSESDDDDDADDDEEEEDEEEEEEEEKAKPGVANGKQGK